MRIVWNTGKDKGGTCPATAGFLLKKLENLQLYCPYGISAMGSAGCLHQESQLRQSRATQPTVHAGCFSVSVIR